MATTVQPEIPPHLLYSQTPYDERGNFHYRGDLFCPDDDLPALCRRIAQHMAGTFPDLSIALRSSRFSGGRKVTVEILDSPEDLTGRDAQDAFIVRLRDQIERFGYTRTNPLQDYWNCSFYAEVVIARAYWAALAARHGPANPVEKILPLASFKKRLKAGDCLTLLHSSYYHRALGQARKVVEVRSKDFVFEGRSFCDFPRAANFACDGRLVRIAIGDEYDPDAHLLYEWRPQAG